MLLNSASPLAQAEVVESVRYMINQETSDYDEEEFNGHLRAPLTGKYTFRLDLFGKAQVFLDKILLFKVSSAKRKSTNGQYNSGSTQNNGGSMGDGYNNSSSSTSTVVEQQEVPLFDTFYSREIELQAGELYEITLKYEYYADLPEAREPYQTRAATVKLMWTIPGGIEQVIPPEYLYHSAEALPGYPIRKTVINDPNPCEDSVIQRHRNLHPDTNPTGIISHTLGEKTLTPEASVQYNPNHLCHYELTTALQKNFKFRIHIEWMDIEMSPDCVFDQVNIWQGVYKNPNGQPRAVLCGNATDEFVLELEAVNAMFFEFFSNQAHEHQGFRINYTVSHLDNPR